MTFEQTNVTPHASIAPAMSAGASTFAPLPPSVGGAADDAGDILGSIAPGGVTDDRQPEFRGQGTPGDTIVIRDNGTEIGTTEVAEDGTWTFTPSTDLLEGLHAITIVARDSSGNESAPSPAFNFEIDVTPPDASRLAITSVADNVGGVTGNVASGATTDDTHPLLSGISTGVPGHTVTVMVRDAAGTRELGQATIGENGQWTFQVDTPLAVGQNTFTLVERDAAGNETMPTGRYTVNVVTDKPSAPVIESVFDDVGTPHMLQPGEATDDARPTLAGRAQASHTVKFYDGSTLLGQVVADASGKWSFTPLANLAEGAHGITATSTNPLGQTSEASGSWNFVVDTTPPAKPTIVSVVDDVGSIVGNVALNGTTDDARPDFSGKAEPNSTVVIYDKGVKLAQVQADASGNWSWTPATALGNGVHAITVTAVDKAGNASVASDAFGFTVATTPPGKPTIVSVIDDVEAITGAIASGTTTNDAKPTFSGKADANGTVIIYDKGVEIDRVQANASGNWTYTPAKALGEGAHSITVAGADQAGNTSAPSGAFEFTVDTAPPVLAQGGIYLSYAHLWYWWALDIPVAENPGVKDAARVVIRYVENNIEKDYYLQVTEGHRDGTITSVWRDLPIPAGIPIKVAFEDAAGNLTAFVSVPVNKTSHFWAYPAGTFGVFEPVEMTDDNIIDSPAQVYTESDETFIARLGFADRLAGGADNDTFMKVGTGDTVHGGAGDDVIRVHSGDFAHIDGGLGIDTLVMHGKAMHIDLSALGPKVQGVEKFDLGSGGNTLALSTHDVLAGGARDMVVADGKVQMLVNGANGEVDLLGGTHGDDGWTQGSNATVGGVTYHVYTNLAGTAELLVEDKVHVTIL
ncbi:hypothetical protein CKY39_28475 [Variovorax boronicumulans]|uniref:Bacterial Ig-like domain-containing protein n=1 Tax=Variovorax boronicumulans TaxID=436515 RepID=A0A250DRK1_9BURK|nr:Ig-like domain-containing protein [Variovorax boronicumulans]ATA56721.1 hypothetical protein CKY39_28475 [Variovorax boronicumulans]